MERVNQTDLRDELQVRFEPSHRARLLAELRARIEAESDDVAVMRARRRGREDRRPIMARLKQVDRIRWALVQAEASLPTSPFELRGPAWLWQATFTGLTLDVVGELELAIRRLNEEGEARGSAHARDAVATAFADLSRWIPMVTAVYEFPPAKRPPEEAGESFE
jgi:hypothetical protein